MTAKRFGAFSKAQPPRWAFVLLSCGRQLRAVAIRGGARGLAARMASTNELTRVRFISDAIISST
jgi:hypothetical protein